MRGDKTSDSGTPTTGSGLAETTGGSKTRGRYPTWQALRWVFLFRLLMVAGLVLLVFPAADEPLIAQFDGALAWRVLTVYAMLVMVSGLSLYARWPSRESQVYLAVFVDLIVFTLVMHAAGGVGSGLGVLLAISVAVSALVMEGRLALLYAAMATLAVMTEQTYVTLAGGAPSSDYTQAGLLGLIFFAVALLAHVLYRRIRDMEALAARRKVDIDDLSKLNAFIIQDMGTGVMVVDGERRLRMMNQAARDLINGVGAPPGAALKEVCSELDDWLAEHVRPSANQGGVIHVGGREIKPSRQLLGDYRAAGVVLYLRDQQELVKEAQQIKLASLGTLTASIAHNIRNPLSAISHAGQLLAEGKGLSPDDRHLLEIIRRNSGRIDEIVRSVLQLSRRNQVDPQPTELVAWLETFCEEFREAHGLPDEQVLLEVESRPISVEVDPRHLHQIVSNLCENAVVHAGDADRPARVMVRVCLVPGTTEAQVEVTDDGPGIDDAASQEIFIPFFTTKPSGTGLGLYIARELAETNGIRLQYERRRPKGSCFRLVFSS